MMTLDFRPTGDSKWDVHDVTKDAVENWREVTHWTHRFRFIVQTERCSIHVLPRAHTHTRIKWDRSEASQSRAWDSHQGSSASKISLLNPFLCGVPHGDHESATSTGFTVLARSQGGQDLNSNVHEFILDQTVGKEINSHSSLFSPTKVNWAVLNPVKS